MKSSYLLFLSLVLFAFGYTKAQSVDNVGKITLSIVMPDPVEDLDASQLARLESKLTHITAEAGFAAVGYDHNFVIYPKLAVYESETVETGMQNVLLVTTELTLFIKQVDNNVIFSTWTKQLKGSGKTKAAAISNAISNIPMHDPGVKAFIEKGKAQILNYYELKCNDIMLKAESLVKSHAYEGAIGLLMTVPDVATCYPTVLDKAVEAYKAYQNQVCKMYIQKARAALEANDYIMSLDLLSDIDPSSTCAAESLSLMKTAGTKVDAEEKRNWDFAMKAYNDSVTLEKMRINAIKEIAVAYYSNRPSMNYTLIVK